MRGFRSTEMKTFTCGEGVSVTIVKCCQIHLKMKRHSCIAARGRPADQETTFPST